MTSLFWRMNIPRVTSRAHAFPGPSRSLSGIAFRQGRFSDWQGRCSIWGAQAVIPLVAYSKLSVPFWFNGPLFPPFYAVSRTHPARNSFRRLLVAHTSFHSRLTFCLPRKLKRRKPRCSSICPKTGSTIALRILYTAGPASVRNLWRIASFGDASAGGGLLLVSTAPPCLSRPVATYRSASFTHSSVTFAALK